ncbi:MAG: uroporphyrinogen decarboxylase family protein [Vicinamibacteria bacterium]
MNGRERMQVAMRLGTPDRVPVMCQLALGHYFLRSGEDAIEIWHDSDAFAEALVRLQQRYRFDGILVNLPGRDPAWRRHLRATSTASDGGRTLLWTNGWRSECPPDDNPHVLREDGAVFHPCFADVEPDRLYYVEPHDDAGLSHPQTWGFARERAEPGASFFPNWRFDTLRRLSARVGAGVSLHGEVFSPFSQMLELLDCTNALLALMDDPAKFTACLDALCEGTIDLAVRQVDAGAQAILISSAFAGAGFLSRGQYEQFVLRHEGRVVAGIRARHDVPVYTHTCGAIGDRLDLLEATGTGGIDTLDPPPLGTVEIAEAKRQLGGRLFLKGNLDPVATLLRGTPHAVREAARQRIALAGPGGGYVLSSACSVPPHAPPENVLALADAAEEFGRYPLALEGDAGR